MMGPVIIGGGGGSGEDAEARAGLATLKGRVDSVMSVGPFIRRDLKNGYRPLDENLSLTAMGFDGDPMIWVKFEAEGASTEFIEGEIEFNVDAPFYQALWEFETEVHNLGVNEFWLGLFAGVPYAELAPPHELDANGYSWATIQAYGDPMIFMMGEIYLSASAEEKETVSVSMSSDGYYGLEDLLRMMMNRTEILADQNVALRSRVADLEAAAE